jgi:hypothetical protein
MGYTLLKVTAAGIVLRDYHARRLTDSPASRAAWRHVAAAMTPGVWAVWTDADGRWHTEPRDGSRLYDGIVTRQLPSPIGPPAVVTPKPRPPCAYDAVRRNGMATLLTDPGGVEIYEACVAAVVGWDGHRIVSVPAGRPRVWSTAEWAVREHLAVREAPIRAGGDLSLLLLNAVKGCCELSAPGRPPFPAAVRREIEQLFDSLTLPGRARPSAASERRSLQRRREQPVAPDDHRE